MGKRLTQVFFLPLVLFRKFVKYGSNVDGLLSYLRIVKYGSNVDGPLSYLRIVKYGSNVDGPLSYLRIRNHVTFHSFKLLGKGHC